MIVPELMVWIPLQVDEYGGEWGFNALPGHDVAFRLTVDASGVTAWSTHTERGEARYWEAQFDVDVGDGADLRQVVTLGKAAAERQRVRELRGGGR